jgi:uncharacterized protein YpmB
MVPFYIFIIAMVLLFLAVVVEANIIYWRDLKRMTPDEYRMFKDEESKDIQNW